MTRGLLSVLLVLAACLALSSAGCVYHPSYEGTRCAADGSCPTGFTCNNDVCVVESPPDGGRDGADADAADAEDAGQDGVDEGPDGADETPDGADETPDGADETPDGVDGTDGADETPDGADETPACGGACPEGQFCDVASNQCQRCEGSDHCGLACLPCDVGASESCQNLGNHGFCCLGPCDYAHACLRRDCNGTTYLCLAQSFQQPIAYAWVEAAGVARELFCALSDQDGMLPERRCAANGENLLVNCPWDGKCEPGGTCQLDLSVVREHDCGAVFGCTSGVCRMHYQDGQACRYNFDCESFCCSREANATCLPAASAEDLCKGRNARYYDGAPHCFKAWDATTPHNMDAWSSQEDWDISCASGCGNGSDCDSGRCDNTVAGKRCWIDGCAGSNEGDIRADYFCAVGDSAEHIHAVTNQAPEPTTPDGCVY
jgi:hypothetical protein